MKYYTKKWYDLMQSSGNCGMFNKIPDKTYTTKEIKTLYDKKLKKMINTEKRAYNQVPSYVLDTDYLNEENFDPEVWVYIDENGNTVRPTSVKEVIRQVFEEFESKPPFDPTEVTVLFKDLYKNELRTCKHNYPSWLVSEVDYRLIALKYLPASSYKKYMDEVKALTKTWKAINQKAEKVLARQNIPEEVNEALELHDAYLLSIKKQGRALIMVFRKDAVWPDDRTPYRKVIFKDAAVLERDKGINVRKHQYDNYYSSNVTFLYDEIYDQDDGFEIHMMFWVTNGLAYVTLQCSSVSYQDGIEVIN